MAEEQPQMLPREQIYNEVWELSLAGVAKKYGTSYGQIYKLCKDTNIPIPPAGYWVKLKFGKPVTKPPLPASSVTLLCSKALRIKKRKINLDSAAVQEAVPVETLPDVKEINSADAGSEKGINEVAFEEEAVADSLDTTETEDVIVDQAYLKELLKIMPEKLVFLDEDKRNIILSIASQIQLPDENAKMHRKISTYGRIVTEWNKNDYKEVGAQKSPQNYSSSKKKSTPPFLAGVISKETLPRVYRILGALVNALETLGCSVKDDLSFIIHNEMVSLEIYEMQDKVEHSVTKSEEKQLREYEERKKRLAWATKPNIRKYDYIFNGRISISLLHNKIFRDTKSLTVEDQLGDIFVEMYEASEIVRKERAAREEERRKREEEERLKEERRNRYKNEVERTVALKNLAQDYDTACKIRAYVVALESSGNLSEEVVAQIEWAKKKADWYDPTIARVDEHLGKREPGTVVESKAKFPWW